jgi:hypothetical protein
MKTYIEALQANTCASYTAPSNLVVRCASGNAELIALLVVALKEATGGPNAAHDSGACNRLLTQAITGLSPEELALLP